MIDWVSITHSGTRTLFQIFDEYDTEGTQLVSVNDTYVAFLPNGGYLATWYYWSSNEAGDHYYEAGHIRGFSALGEVQFHIELDSGQEPFGIFAFPTSQLAIGWSDESVSYLARAINVSLIDTDAQVLGQTAVIEGTAGGNISELQSSFTTDGALLLSWRSGARGDVDWNLAALQAEEFGTVSHVVPNVAEPDVYRSFYDPEVAVLQNGNYVLAWADFAPEVGSEFYIHFRIVTPEGTIVASDRALISAMDADQNTPTVHVFDNGDFGVFYASDYVSSANAIYFQRFSEDGTQLVEETFVGTLYNSIGDHYGRVHVADLADGGFVAGWTPNYYITDFELSRFDADGVLLGEDFRTGGQTSANATMHGIRANADGGFEVVVHEASTSDTATRDLLVYEFENQFFGRATDDGLATYGDLHWIDGQGGNDTIWGGVSADTLKGGDGADVLIGAEGDDALVGGTTEDDLRDVIYGGAGHDNIDGGYGNDELRGDAGDDVVVGGFGADTVIGGEGDDELTGQALGDVLFGGAGADFINGGFGHDRVNGGADADRFFHIGVADHGSDWIQDYSAIAGDVLVFGGVSSDLGQFQVNRAETAGAGLAGVEEAFVIFRPTGQILWALVDGGSQSEINMAIDGVTYDLLA